MIYAGFSVETSACLEISMWVFVCSFHDEPLFIGETGHRSWSRQLLSGKLKLQLPIGGFSFEVACRFALGEGGRGLRYPWQWKYHTYNFMGAVRFIRTRFYPLHWIQPTGTGYWESYCLASQYGCKKALLDARSMLLTGGQAFVVQMWFLAVRP